MRIVFNQRPTAALHQPYGDPSTFFAPGIFLDPRPNEIFAHRFIQVKVTMLTTWHLDGSVFQSSSVDSSIPIVDLPLSPKNIATRQHEIPLKLSILEASVDWKRGAGRMLAYINLSRCIEAMPRCRPIRVIGKKRRDPRDLSLSLFVGGTTTTTLGSDIIDQAGKDVLAGYRATFDDDLARPRPVHDCASTRFLSIGFVRLLFMGETTRGCGSTIDFSNVSSEKIRFTFGHRSSEIRITEQRFERKESDMCHIFSFELIFI